MSKFVWVLRRSLIASAPWADMQRKMSSTQARRIVIIVSPYGYYGANLACETIQGGQPDTVAKLSGFRRSVVIVKGPGKFRMGTTSQSDDDERWHEATEAPGARRPLTP